MADDLCRRFLLEGGGMGVGVGAALEVSIYMFNIPSMRTKRA